MSNKNLLTIIIVILLGIFAVILLRAQEKSPSEQIGDSISATIEEIGDEIDDNTTGN